MKKFTLTFCAIFTAVGVAFGGTESYSGKEMKQTTTEAPCPTWYADNEFNLGLWGAVAFGGGGDNHDNGNNDDDGERLIINDPFRPFDRNDDDDDNDRDFVNDMAFGGGMDLKYFFSRYFGIGIQAFGLFDNDDSDKDLEFDRTDVRILKLFGIDAAELEDRDDDNASMGAVLGTFTLRYPMECSRFAPYAWVGGGIAFGGDDNNDDFDHFRFRPAFGDFERLSNFDDDEDNNGDAQAIGQVGVGLETRFMEHVGWIIDISWNITEDDNWGMARTGVNFAF